MLSISPTMHLTHLHSRFTTQAFNILTSLQPTRIKITSSCPSSTTWCSRIPPQFPSPCQEKCKTCRISVKKNVFTGLYSPCLKSPQSVWITSLLFSSPLTVLGLFPLSHMWCNMQLSLLHLLINSTPTLHLITHHLTTAPSSDCVELLRVMLRENMTYRQCWRDDWCMERRSGWRNFCLECTSQAMTGGGNGQ